MVTPPTETRRAPRFARRASASVPSSADASDAMEELEPQAPLRDTPANENEPGIAAIISALKRRPPTTTIYLTGAASFVWMIIVLASNATALRTSPLELPVVLQVIALAILPGAIALAAAYLLYRAQQLRQVSESLTQTTMRLVRPQDIASDSLMGVAISVREELNGLMSGVEQAVKRASELEGMVHREIANIERAFGGNEERIRNLISGLENQRVALQQTGYLIGSETNPLLTRLEQNTHSLDQIIQVAQSALTSLDHGLKTSTVELTRTVEDAVQRGGVVSTEIGTQAERIAQMTDLLKTGIETFRQHLDDQVESLSRTSSNFSIESATFSESVRGLETNVVSSVRTGMTELSSLHSEVVRTVDRLAGSLSEQIRNTSSQVTDLLQTTGSSVNWQLQTTTQETVRQIERSSEMITTAIHSTGDGISDRMLTISSDFMGNVNRTRDEIFNFMDEAGNMMSGQLSATAGDILGRMEHTSSMITGRLAAESSEFTKRVEHSALNIAELLQQTSDGLHSRVEAAATQIATKLDESGAVIVGAMSETAEDTVARIEQAANAVTNKLSETGNQVTGRIDQSADNLSGVLGRTAEAITSRIEQSTDSAGNLVAGLGELLGERMEMATSGLNDVLANSAERVAGHVGEAVATVSAEIQALAEVTSGNVTQAAETAVSGLADMTDQLTSKIEIVSNTISQKLDIAGGTMFERLETTANQLGNSFDQAADLLKTVTSDIGSRMHETTNNFGVKLEDAAMAIRADLERAGGAFSREVEETIGTVAQTMQGTTSELLAQLAQQTNALHDAGVLTVQRLDETSQRFAQHVRETNTFFANQLDEAASQLDEKLEISGTGLSKRLEEATGSITGRLEDVTGIVEGAVQGLNQEIERMLMSREDALTELVDRMGKRSGDVEAMMRSYLTAIEDQLIATEARSSEIGRLVNQQAEETALSLDAQIQRLEELADAKINAAARQLRASYENAVSTMNEMLTLSAGEFTQTVQGMRAAAEQVARDIESAREELGGAIASLPEETRANADAMRQIVVDQISALQAISDVVRRQSGNAAVSLPVQKRNWQDAPADRPEGTTPSLRQTSTLRKPSLRSSRADSRSKMPEAARAVVEAMEGTLPRDLERRWQAGEDGVYLRRLIGLRNSKVQDALASRYLDDADLRAKMDAYVDGFERVLDELSSGRDAEEQVETALGSDAGKVFMMLAQASGRMQG